MGGIPDSEQLGTDTIWGYPEYGAICDMVSPGLDGLRHHFLQYAII